MRSLLVFIPLVIAAATVAVTLAASAPLPAPPPREVDWSAHRAGPSDAQRVYWVGAGVLRHRDPRAAEPRNAMEMVRWFARSATVGYTGYDHTHPDASLALLWRGWPQTYNQAAPEMVERRHELEDRGGAYDALVLAERPPIRRNITANELGAFYAQKFYCALIHQNPKARIYLVEAWDPAQGGPDYRPRYRWNWRQRLQKERPYVERLADLSMTGQVPAPGLKARVDRLVLGDDGGGCPPRQPIFLVPVGTVLARLVDALQAPDAAAWRWADGRPVEAADVVQNPYEGWPPAWPLPKTERPAPGAVAGLRLRNPDAPFDDLNPSALGAYITALTHFAVLYRRTPVGLPPLEGMPPAMAEALQNLVWQVVTSDERTGVSGVSLES